MPSVASTFTAVGNSSNLFVKAGQALRLSLTGTWVGQVDLQRSGNGGQSFETVASFTASASGLYPAVPPLNTDYIYRLACVLYTSGTVTYSIINQVKLTNRARFSTCPIGSVAYGSFGTSTTPVAGTLYIADVVIERDMVVHGIGALIGGTGGTDKFIYALYDSAGNLVGNTATAGVTVGTLNTCQEILLTNEVSIKAGQYFIGVQLNGTTARLRTMATATFITPSTDSVAGTFATLPNITVPTTFTADKGPIAYVYGY